MKSVTDLQVTWAFASLKLVKADDETMDWRPEQRQQLDEQCLE